MSTRTKNSNKKKKKWLKWTLIISLLFVVGIGVYGFSIYRSLTSATDQMHQSIDRDGSDKRAEEVQFEEKDPFSVLLLGIDRDENGTGRSDTMMVMTVNPQEETTKILSIPRDTYTEMIGAGYGYDDKINHAYAFGGVPMAMDTVENLLDIPIDYFVEVSMEGFEELVDAVDGVTINNNFSFESGGHSFPEGELSLSGDEALAFTRMRYEDPNGDFGRQERQRQVMEAFIQEGASVNSLWNFGNIFDALGNNIKTNLSLDQMVDIQREYRAAASSLEQSTIENGSGQMIDGIYYYVVPDEEISKIQSSLKDHLNL
ncbi:LCP family glycopolymer transferase [Jeotgalibacillus marinus]|uniref:Polyisoprenyl-teichoic acid--peptidoglycan teichoic acid transferase TagU n=1 Tax=Jeotgalibacillus marinus TaxID=86667 RepID=A0ABV3Q0B4_9BACL